ncbi:hypothetical protein [Vibrio vulnificus]|uniref:hypothetical protein n=1 Tax=Vibrio vulnificus TaxID=672 RepID=UPI00324230A1
MIIPNKDWWQEESSKRSSLKSCPYANSHTCPRYYESVFLLSQINMIAGLAKNKSDELDQMWANTSFSALCAEEVPSIGQNQNGSLSSVSNFCPEVSFKYLGYYADYMCKYVDEIDQAGGERLANRDKLADDWRYFWRSVSAKFYLDCEVYDRVKYYNEELGQSYLNRLHPNIVQLVSRMDRCLDNQDPAGAVHSAANILETMAKDITNNPKVANQTLGGFFSQFEKCSKLPQPLIDAILEIYKVRNTLPTAGHGSLVTPTLTMVEGISIAALTKAILEIEYRAKSI